MESEKKNPRRGANWILWWKIDPDELEQQVAQYASLSIVKSARGISLLLFLLSVAITVAFIQFSLLDATGYIDAGLMLVLGLLVFRGYRWAMIAAMVLWTVEKAILIVTPLTVGSGSPANPVMQILWWAVYMHPLYLAFRVEQARRRPADAAEVFK